MDLGNKRNVLKNNTRLLYSSINLCSHEKLRAITPIKLNRGKLLHDNPGFKIKLVLKALIGTFRLDYEYGIEYEYDFRISN